MASYVAAGSVFSSRASMQTSGRVLGSMSSRSCFHPCTNEGSGLPRSPPPTLRKVFINLFSLVAQLTQFEKHLSGRSAKCRQAGFDLPSRFARHTLARFDD